MHLIDTTNIGMQIRGWKCFFKFVGDVSFVADNALLRGRVFCTNYDVFPEVCSSTTSII